MKKAIAFIITLILILSFCMTACSQTKFNTAYDLYKTWADSNNFPDYVCGVWSYDGSEYNITIAVKNTNDGQKGIEEIRNLVKDDSSLRFTYLTHSRNYLTSVQDDLKELFGTYEEHGLFGTSLAEKDNKIVLSIHHDYKGNAATEKLVQELIGKYGYIFEVFYTTNPSEDNVLCYGDIDNKNSNNNPHLLYAITIIVLSLTVVFLIIFKNNSHLLQTADGEIFKTSSPFSKNDIKNMVRNSCAVFPENLDKKILNTINKK